VERPTRRSGRIAGIEASVEEVQKRVEEEEKEREVLRVVSRKTREKVMALDDMVEESSPAGKEELVGPPILLSSESPSNDIPSAFHVSLCIQLTWPRVHTFGI
jgi:hypothetical protein